MTDEQQAQVVEAALSQRVICPKCSELRTHVVKADPFQGEPPVTACNFCWSKLEAFKKFGPEETQMRSNRIEIIEYGQTRCIKDRYGRFEAPIANEDLKAPYDAH